jgi:uncharacterized protein (UPF0261 family)
MPTVVLIGTLDTKGAEYAFLRERIEAEACDVLLVDAGVLGEPHLAADIDREAVARAGGADLAALVAARPRRRRRGDGPGRGRGRPRPARRGRLHALAGLGGSGGTTIATAAMRALPVGVPKLMVSTLAAGDTRPYVGAVDVAMLYSVVDIAGLNRSPSRSSPTPPPPSPAWPAPTPPTAPLPRPNR